MKLHLGVFDIPYADHPGITTGDVAEILEARYHPWEIFYALNEQKIADQLADGFAGSLESVVMGARIEPRNFFTAGTAEIERDYKQFLETGQLETLGYPGLPTRAALQRRSLRFKSKKAGRARPSLIDTGQYEASSHAWVDEG